MSQAQESSDTQEQACDIVAALSRRFMNDVAEEIFSYLDYYSLKQSELVSNVWHKNVLFGNTWKFLLQKNVQKFKKWKDVLAILNFKFASFFENEEKDGTFYRTLCQGVGETVKKIDRNWKHGPESKYQVSHFSQPELESIFWIPGSFVFELNQKWIGRSQHDGCIALWNRWTWEFYKLFEPSFVAHHTYGSRSVRCLQFNDELIAAGYFGGEICLWDIQTAELMFVFDDNIDGLASHHIHLNCLSLAGSSGSYWLLSSLKAPNHHQDSVTLRQIKFPHSDEATVNGILIDHHLRVKRIYMIDAEHFLVLLSNSQSKNDLIEVRCSITMVVLLTFPLTQFETGGLAYRTINDRGLILTGSHKILNLWDVQSGIKIRELESNSTIMFVTFIGEDFFLSCNASGQFELWNLRVALNPNLGTPGDEGWLIRRFSALDVTRPLLCPIIRADEYQIALIPDRSESHAELHIIDMICLNELKLLPGKSSQNLTKVSSADK